MMIPAASSPLYVSRVPRPPLDRFIAALWYCRRPPAPLALERVLPQPSAALIVNLAQDQVRSYHPDTGRLCEAVSSGAILSGLRPGYTVIDTAEQEHVAGVAFRPGGTLPFFALPAHELPAADTPLAFLWRAAASELRECLLAAPTPAALLDTLEAFLLARCRFGELHPAVAHALLALARPDPVPAIASLAGQAGLSPKRFIERFKSSVGIPPKQFSRMLRFRRALALAESGRSLDWTRIALDCGYFDQAHFIHDFRSFSGLTPTAYAAARTEFVSHVKFLQSDFPSA